MSPSPKTLVDVTAPTAAPGIVWLAVRFGLGAGLIGIAWVIFLQLTGNNAFGPKQIMGLLAVPLAVIGSQWLLRRNAKPDRPGVGRTLAVGTLTTLLAANLAAAGVWGLAHAVGANGLKLARAEMVDIVRVQQQQRDKAKRNPQLEQTEIQQASALPVDRFAFGTFTWVLLLGTLVGVPSGIFLRK